MFFFVYIFLIVFFLIQSRIYDSIDKIQEQLCNKIHNLNIKFEMQGTNDYLYKFESKSFIFNFKNGSFNDIAKNIKLFNKTIEIIFNLSVYESNDKIFNIFHKNIIHTELIKAGIKFELLRFYQCKKDFSFDVLYNIKDIDKDMIIYFDTMNELETFNYLIYEDRNEYYENKTLYDLMKTNIVNNFIKEIRKLLIIYPECDLLYYIKSLIDYLQNYVFKIEKTICDYVYYKEIIDYITYETTIKRGDTIILENVNIAFTLIYNNYYSEEEDMEDKKEKQIISLESLSFDSNKNITFGRLTRGEYFVFDIFKVIIMESRDKC